LTRPENGPTLASCGLHIVEGAEHHHRESAVHLRKMPAAAGPSRHVVRIALFTEFWPCANSGVRKQWRLWMMLPMTVSAPRREHTEIPRLDPCGHAASERAA
jgi:hypothetical protein